MLFYQASQERFSRRSSGCSSRRVRRSSCYYTRGVRRGSGCSSRRVMRGSGCSRRRVRIDSGSCVSGEASLGKLLVTIAAEFCTSVSLVSLHKNICFIINCLHGLYSLCPCMFFFPTWVVRMTIALIFQYQ